MTVDIELDNSLKSIRRPSNVLSLDDSKEALLCAPVHEPIHHAIRKNSLSLSGPFPTWGKVEGLLDRD